ncbi:MAG TPA: Ig-like domain-containing protein, partial [Longimicrobium sp.]|nr:Ig-like domain-containing protein [Longimicrobium sp.]
MPAPRLLALRIAPFALILALAACDERTPSTPPPGATPSALRVSAGDGQTGVVGAELPSELAVEVVDAAGRPLAGIAVQFAVVAGGGRVAAATATSDASGLARTRWTLGTVTADSQVVEARLEQVAPVRLRAAVRADAPASIAVVAGSGGAGPVGAALADSLGVTVKDRYGNPAAGIELAWEVTAGGGALSPARSMTGADGTARTQWTLGPRVDSVQSVVARVAGLGYVGFMANAVTAGAPLVLAKRGGDGQRGTADGVLADSLGVVLRMPDGRPVAGALVSWSVPPAAGVVSPAVARTDANGAASAVWRLGTTPGLAQATATVDSGTLVFTALTEADAPAAVEAVAGGGTGGVGRALADSLAVRLTDRHGNPVPGAAVDWSAQTGG